MWFWGWGKLKFMLPDSLVPQFAFWHCTCHRLIDQPVFYIYQIKISHNFPPLFFFFLTALRRSLIRPVAPHARKHAPLTPVRPSTTTPRPQYVFIPCAPPAAVTTRRVQCNRIGSRPLDVRRCAGAHRTPLVPSQCVSRPYGGRPASSTQPTGHASRSHPATRTAGHLGRRRLSRSRTPCAPSAVTAVNGGGGAGARDAIPARSCPTTTTMTVTAATVRPKRFQVIILPTVVVVVVVGVWVLNVSLTPTGKGCGGGVIRISPWWRL